MAGEMAQWANSTFCKPDGPRSNPWTHTIEENIQLPNIAFKCHGAHNNAHMLKQTHKHEEFTCMLESHVMLMHIYGVQYYFFVQVYTV